MQLSLFSVIPHFPTCPYTHYHTITRDFHLSWLTVMSCLVTSPLSNRHNTWRNPTQTLHNAVLTSDVTPTPGLCSNVVFARRKAICDSPPLPGCVFMDNISCIQARRMRVLSPSLVWLWLLPGSILDHDWWWLRKETWACGVMKDTVMWYSQAPGERLKDRQSVVAPQSTSCCDTHTNSEAEYQPSLWKQTSPWFLL